MFPCETEPTAQFWHSKSFHFEVTTFTLIGGVLGAFHTLAFFAFPVLFISWMELCRTQLPTAQKRPHQKDKKRMRAKISLIATQPPASSSLCGTLHRTMLEEVWDVPGYSGSVPLKQ